MSYRRHLLVFAAALFLVTQTAVAEPENWSAREKRILAFLSLDPAYQPPPSPSNKYAEDEAARSLGARLFGDTRLSINGKISCLTCHQPAKYFTDGRSRSQGIGTTLRNAPTLVGSSYFAWFYWDGRRDSLWAQALIPIEAPDEMGGSRLAATRLVAEDPTLREHYERAFGTLPVEITTGGLPPQAGPLGSPEARDAWHRLPANTRRAINIVFANLGKAIAAHERTFVPEPTRFDKYVRSITSGDLLPGDSTFSTDEIAGAKLFIDQERTACLQCHNGPMLSNGGFANIGSGNFEGKQMDYGRVFGLSAALMDEFNCLGPYSDAAPSDCLELNFLNRDSHIPLEGAFKIPSLRGLGLTAPFFHDGRFTTLREVIQYYIDTPDQLQAGTHELRPLELTDIEIDQLIQFLLTLSD